MKPRAACIYFCIIFWMALLATACDRPDKFDPGDVYIFGTLASGRCEFGAVAHWGDPSTPLVGFDCYANDDSAIVRPTDGRLLYMNHFENLIREFHCDGCPDVLAQLNHACEDGDGFIGVDANPGIKIGGLCKRAGLGIGLD